MEKFLQKGHEPRRKDRERGERFVHTLYPLCGFSPASAISPKRLYRRKNFEYCFSELPLTAVISPRKIQETSSGRLSIKISLTMSVIPMRMTIIAQKPSESHDTDFVRESSLKIPTKNRIRKATIAIR